MATVINVGGLKIAPYIRGWVASLEPSPAFMAATQRTAVQGLVVQLRIMADRLERDLLGDNDQTPTETATDDE